MKGYRKITGEYIEIGDNTPHADSFVEVALKPDNNHVFSDNWQSDPMNPAVCWRPKTPAEIDAEKDALASLLADLKPVIESVLEIIYENPDLNAAFGTINQFKLAVKDRYKSKL